MGSYKELVSVIIPTYNCAGFLPDAIESVLNQTHQNTEIILIDDGSTDKTKNIVEDFRKRFPEKFFYIRIEHSGHAGIVRNVGLKKSKGDFVAFLDSDDMWLPKKLQKQINIMKSYPNVGLVCSNSFVLEKNQKKPSRYYFQDSSFKEGYQPLKKLLLDNFIITSTVLVRKDILKKVGLFIENNLVKVGEDYDLWLRTAIATDVYYLKEALSVYRNRRKNSIRGQISDKEYRQGMLFIIEHFEKELIRAKILNSRLNNLIKDIKNGYQYNLDSLNKGKSSHDLPFTIHSLVSLTKKLFASNKKFKERNN